MEENVDSETFFDDIQDALETKALLAKGFSNEDIQRHRETKVTREKISFYLYCEKSKSPIITPTEIAINLAFNYEKIGRRALAIAALRRLQAKCSDDAVVDLLLSKLLFRNNEKQEAEKVISVIVDRFKREQDLVGSTGTVALEDAADAFYILGWIKIHSDDHTEAYKIWSDGYKHIPSDKRLERQFLKVKAWQSIYFSNDHWNKVQCVDGTDSKDCQDCETGNSSAGSSCESIITSVIRTVNDGFELGCSDVVATSNSASSYEHLQPCLSDLIGKSSHSDGIFDIDKDFDIFAIPEGIQEPALMLFQEHTQHRNLIFRTKTPVLTSDECASVVQVVEEHILQRGGHWPTVRSASVKTTDIAVEDVPILRSWMRCLLAQILQPMLATCYPLLADGTTLGPRGGRLRVHDAFIVRYDADTDGSTHLPMHCDTSCVSFTIALNSGFEGGGTLFSSLSTPSFDGVVEATTGQAVAFAGPLRHGGHAVTRGVRVILVLFMYVDSFAYQEFLTLGTTLYTNENSSSNLHTNENSREDEEMLQEEITQDVGISSEHSSSVSLSAERQYVVYRETLDLMTTLNRFPLEED